jgi:hypothetical protein
MFEEKEESAFFKKITEFWCTTEGVAEVKKEE